MEILYEGSRIRGSVLYVRTFLSAKGVDCETRDKPTFDRKLWI